MPVVSEGKRRSAKRWWLLLCVTALIASAASAQVPTTGPLSLAEQLAEALKTRDAAAAVDLVRRGADVNLRPSEFPLLTGNGSAIPTVLMLVAALGDERLLLKTLKAGAKVNVGDDLGWTPLMLATAAGDPTGVKLLLAAGAKVQAETRYGVMALGLAEGIGRPEIIRLLKEAGARNTNPKRNRRWLVLREGFSGEILLPERIVSIKDRTTVGIGSFDGRQGGGCTVGHRTCPDGYGDKTVWVHYCAGLILIEY